MPGFPSPFGGESDDDDLFTDSEEFDPEYSPKPGQFLEDHDLLTGDEHVTFHQISETVFEERGVYDMTFGYNLAQLNQDTRHPNAGYRYAKDADDPSVLRAEFTPTTPFCPQSDTLTKGSFRAWNGLNERHEYDLVRVRVADMHHRSETINEALEEMEREFRDSGRVNTVSTDETRGRTAKEGKSWPEPGGDDSSPEAPF
jgi:hypothetical protein